MRDETTFRECYCLALSQASRRLNRIYDAHLAAFGLRIGQFGLMSLIRQTSGLTLGELAERNVMDPSTVSRLMRPLAARNLVAMDSDPEDRRVRRLRLTSTGCELHDRALSAWKAAHQYVGGRLGETAGRTLLEATSVVVASIGADPDQSGAGSS